LLEELGKAAAGGWWLQGSFSPSLSLLSLSSPLFLSLEFGVVFERFGRSWEFGVLGGVAGGFLGGFGWFWWCAFLSLLSLSTFSL